MWDKTRMQENKGQRTASQRWQQAHSGKQSKARVETSMHGVNMREDTPKARRTR